MDKLTFAPEKDYSNHQQSLYWGTVAKDTPEQIQQVLQKERVSTIRRLVLNAAQKALCSSSREILVPGTLSTTLQNGRFLVTQNCFKLAIIPSCLRAKNTEDPLTQKAISADDIRSKRALLIGDDAFQVDSLLLHMLKQPASAQLNHPLEKRPLTEAEQIQLLAELSLCCSIKDPSSIENVFCNRDGLTVLQNVSDKNDLTFLIQACHLLNLMSLPKIKILTPQLWSEFERLFNLPKNRDLLDRPPLKKIKTALQDLLAQQYVCRMHLNTPSTPLQDYKMGKSFIFWGTGPYLKLENHILKYDVIRADQRMDELCSQNGRAKVALHSLKMAKSAKEGDIVPILTNSFEPIFDREKNCTFYLEWIFYLTRKCRPTPTLNQKTDNGYIDPISLDEIPENQLDAPHVIGIGGYVFIVKDCLRRMLSQKAPSNGEVPHPLDNRTLTLEEKYNFFANMGKKLNIDGSDLAVCWGSPVNEMIATFIKQNSTPLPPEPEIMLGIKGVLLFDFLKCPDDESILGTLYSEVEKIYEDSPAIQELYALIIFNLVAPPP